MLVALLAFNRSGGAAKTKGPEWPKYPADKGTTSSTHTPMDDQPGGGTVPGARTSYTAPALTPLPGTGWKLYTGMPSAVHGRAFELMKTLTPGQLAGPEADASKSGREVVYRKEKAPSAPTGWSVTVYYRDATTRADIPVDTPPPDTHDYTTTEKTDSDKGGLFTNVPPDEYPDGDRITDYVNTNEEAGTRPKA